MHACMRRPGLESQGMDTPRGRGPHRHRAGGPTPTLRARLARKVSRVVSPPPLPTMMNNSSMNLDHTVHIYQNETLPPINNPYSSWQKIPAERLPGHACTVWRGTKHYPGQITLIRHAETRAAKMAQTREHRSFKPGRARAPPGAVTRSACDGPRQVRHPAARPVQHELGLFVRGWADNRPSASSRVRAMFVSEFFGRVSSRGYSSGTVSPKYKCLKSRALFVETKTFSKTFSRHIRPR